MPSLALNDLEGIRREAELKADLEFSGKGSIHPKQIAILNDAFSPDEAEIEHAKRILEAFTKADTGLIVVDGKLIEKPLIREMTRVLAIAERVASQHTDQT